MFFFISFFTFLVTHNYVLMLNHVRFTDVQILDTLRYCLVCGVQTSYVAGSTILCQVSFMIWPFQQLVPVGTEESAEMEQLATTLVRF